MFSEKSLGIINNLELSANEREHVILAYLNHRDRFNILDVEAPNNWRAYPLSLALDTHKDFMLISDIIQTLSKVKSNFGLDDILDYINKKRTAEKPRD